MTKLKNSEQMLNFLKDLSNFTQTFSTFKRETQEKEKPREEKTDKEKPQSPTEGIADEFIQNILDNYLKQHWPTLYTIEKPPLTGKSIPVT